MLSQSGFGRGSIFGLIDSSAHRHTSMGSACQPATPSAPTISRLYFSRPAPFSTTTKGNGQFARQKRLASHPSVSHKYYISCNIVNFCIIDATVDKIMSTVQIKLLQYTVLIDCSRYISHLTATNSRICLMNRDQTTFAELMGLYLAVVMSEAHTSETGNLAAADFIA